MGCLYRLKEEKLIETSSSPSALVLDPARMQENRKAATRRDLAASRTAMSDALAADGLNASAFKETFGILDGLRQEVTVSEHMVEISFASLPLVVPV